MNLHTFQNSEKNLSVKLLFKAQEGQVNSIQLLKETELPEHITKIPALLVCVQGDVRYQDENNQEMRLKPGDYYEISPEIKHWLMAFEDSQLLLIK